MRRAGAKPKRQHGDADTDREQLAVAHVQTWRSRTHTHQPVNFGECDRGFTWMKVPATAALAQFGLSSVTFAVSRCTPKPNLRVSIVIAKW